MADTSWMARVGARLVTNGYAILPIAPGTKKPGQFARAGWHDYPQWNRHASRATTEHEVATWSSWPDCGVGIVGGAVAALDIDVAEDGELALHIERLARERLGDTPALRIGKAPKRLMVYRTREPFAGIRRAPLEVLCLGQQFMAYAKHPDTGQPYAWPDEGLADLDIESLPEIDAEQAAAFLDEALTLIPPELRPKSLGAKGANGAGHPCLPAHAQAGTLEAIRSALAWLPNAELDYDSWMRIGMALKGALGEEGATLFADWSAQAVKNEPAATAKAWTSFKPARIGAGTIYHLAMENGWRPDADLLLDGSQKVCEADEHPAAGLLARLAQPEAPMPIIPPAPSFTLTIPGGLVGDLARYMIDTARRPQPLLAVGASLCALGALMGRRYRTVTDLRTNLYIVGIADSGSGKNHAREVVNELFFAAGLAHHLGGNKIASGAGLLTALHRQPAILFQIDEFGMFLAAAADRKRSPRHVTEILDNMAGKTSGPETAVDPMTVPMDDDAQARFDALGEEITAELRAAAGTFQTPILARIAENAAKVALVLAVGRDAVKPVIRVVDAVWAIDFVRHFARRTIDAVERHVADTETEAHLKRLREIIRKAGTAGVTKSELTRASQWLRARDRDDILLTLVESGDIVPVEQETGGRKAMRFRAMR